MGVFKNDVGRPTNETIKKRRILKVILALLVAGALFTGGYYVNEFINKYDVNKEEKENENVMSKKQAEKLISIVSQVNINSEKFGYFYKQDRNIDNLDNDVILISAISKLITVDKRTFTKSEVNQSVKKIFGDIKYKDESVSSYCYEFNYDASKELYTDNSGCSGDGPDIYSEIINVENSSNKLTIIDKIAVSDFDYDSGILTLYKDLNRSIVIKENYDLDEGIKEYLDILDSYKWTFVKNSEGNYIFESVEKISDDNKFVKYSTKEAFNKFAENYNLIIAKDGDAFDLDALKSINCKTASTAYVKDNNELDYAISIHEFVNEEAAKKEYNNQKEYQKTAGEGIIEIYEREILTEKSEVYYDVHYDVFEIKSVTEDILGSMAKSYDHYYSVRLDNYYISLFSSNYNDMTSDVKKLIKELNILLDIS